MVVEAFKKGNPRAAFEATQELNKAYQEALAEASTLRFRLNFGGEVCNSCEGLRAGPGVSATCFQVQRCNYSNVKEGEASPRHLRVLQSLSK